MTTDGVQLLKEKNVILNEDEDTASEDNVAKPEEAKVPKVVEAFVIPEEFLAKLDADSRFIVEWALKCSPESRKALKVRIVLFVFSFFRC